MYALEKIVANADVYKLLEHYGFNTSDEDGTILRSHCAIHGGNNPSAFAFNTESNLWFCHTNPDCGGGDIFTLVEKMENVSFTEATKFLADFFRIDIEGLDIIERKSRNQKEISNFIKIMSKRRAKKPMDTFKVEDKLFELSTFRDFKEDTIKYFGLKFAKEITLESKSGKEYKLYNRLVFPIICNDIKIGASIRATKNNDNPKWSHQPTDIKTSELLYNYDSVIPGGTVVVVEGIVDVWAYHEINIVAVCTFGAHLTDNQYRMLLISGADVVLSYDGDDAGRKATSKATEMLKDKCNLYKVEMKQGEDPANITREELMNRYELRTKQ